ncbi:MAG: hypothetical protein D6748_00945 [Calditrichaeota bacterium]|nr:MAG: hypothetical protein D6748_00945 [Calditrichota bacterium]
MWKAWVNFVLGLWLILSGIITTLGVQANYIIVGIVVAVLGFWTGKIWQGIVTGILGIWLFLSGLISTLMAPINMLIVGVIVAGLSLWEALQRPHTPAPQH